jgi:hypothetical protein
VRANDKHHGRLNVIRDMLWRLPYPGHHKRVAPPDPNIVFPFEPDDLENGMIAR